LTSCKSVSFSRRTLHYGVSLSLEFDVILLVFIITCLPVSNINSSVLDTKDNSLDEFGEDGV